MPLPALLAAVLPFLGGAAASAIGQKITNGRNGNNRNRVQFQDPNNQISLEEGPASNWWSGTPAYTKQFSNFTPQQSQVFPQLIQQALAGLGRNQFDFAPIENQARENFAQKTIPSIAERFTSLGAQRSSAFPQLLSQAGSNLETNLASMKQDYGLQQQQLLQSLLALGLTPQFERQYFPGQEGLGRSTAQSLLSALPTLGSAYFGSR